jgi:hypothetical protein
LIEAAVDADGKFVYRRLTDELSLISTQKSVWSFRKHIGKCEFWKLDILAGLSYSIQWVSWDDVATPQPVKLVVIVQGKPKPGTEAILYPSEKVKKERKSTYTAMH